MLDLRRLRLLHELHARGTIAAVADALRFTPSAVSQQLAVLEREAGVPLLEKAGRRVRIAAFQSVALRVAAPALHALARAAPALRCELVEAEPEDALPALALGDLDLLLGDEWQHQPHARLAGLERRDLHRDPVLAVLPAAHPRAVDRAAVELAG